MNASNVHLYVQKYAQMRMIHCQEKALKVKAGMACSLCVGVFVFCFCFLDVSGCRVFVECYIMRACKLTSMVVYDAVLHFIVTIFSINAGSDGTKKCSL